MTQTSTEVMMNCTCHVEPHSFIIPQTKVIEQAAYDRGFKDGDHCTAQSVGKAYEQGFAEAVERVAKVVHEWTVWTPEHIEQLEIKIRQMKPGGGR